MPNLALIETKGITVKPLLDDFGPPLAGLFSVPSTFQKTENQVATDYGLQHGDQDDGLQHGDREDGLQDGDRDDRLQQGDQDVGESIQLHLVADKGLRKIRRAENG
jgi:hypothetical protein